LIKYAALWFDVVTSLNRTFKILTSFWRALAIAQNITVESNCTEQTTLCTGRAGRLKVLIPKETLSFLLELGLKFTEIAQMFSVNVRTILLRMEAFNFKKIVLDTL
jgi:hypothetical protein